MEDKINPNHYKKGKYEVIDCIESLLTPDEFKGYLKGNVIKYNARERFKNGTEDINKGAWYQNRLAALSNNVPIEAETIPMEKTKDLNVDILEIPDYVKGAIMNFKLHYVNNRSYSSFIRYIVETKKTESSKRTYSFMFNDTSSYTDCKNCVCVEEYFKEVM